MKEDYTPTCRHKVSILESCEDCGRIAGDVTPINEVDSSVERFREIFTSPCPEIPGRRDLKSWCGTTRLEELIKEEKELSKAQGQVEGISKAIEAIDPFDLVRECNPDCTPEEHAYHQGTWDSHLKLQKILETLKEIL